MPRTPAEQDAWEIQCFGQPEEVILAQVESGLYCEIATDKDKSGGKGMIAMSILSNAQEVILRDDLESARQFINQAKLIIRKYWMEGK